MACTWTFQGPKIYSRVHAMPDSITVRYIIQATRQIMFREKFALSFMIHVRCKNVFCGDNVKFLKVNLAEHKIATWL
jgi:hypothetical protein